MVLNRKKGRYVLCGHGRTECFQFQRTACIGSAVIGRSRRCLTLRGCLAHSSQHHFQLLLQAVIRFAGLPWAREAM